MRNMILGAAALMMAAGVASADVQVFTGNAGTQSFNATQGSRITAGLFGSGADTTMGLISPGGGVLASDDDGGVSAQSAIRVNADATGSFSLVMREYPSFDFANPLVTTPYNYRLVVSTGATGTESGTNTSRATASPLVYGTGGSAMDGSLRAGAANYFSFSGLAGELVTAQVDDFGTGTLDTVLGLFNASGTVLAGNDDGSGSSGFNSVLEFVLPADGTYYWALSGYPDFDFTGGHIEAGDFRLVTSGGTAIPGPGAAALLGVGGLMAARRRRREA